MPPRHAGPDAGSCSLSTPELFPESPFPEPSLPEPPSPELPAPLNVRFSAPLNLEASLGTESATDVDAAVSSIQESVWAGRTRSYRPLTVEDAEEEEDILGPEEDAAAAELSEEEREVWERLWAEERAEAEYEAISVWDELAEFFLREGMIHGKPLHISTVCNESNVVHMRWCAYGGGFQGFTTFCTQGRHAHARQDLRKASPCFPRQQHFYLEGDPGPRRSPVRLSAAASRLLHQLMLCIHRASLVGDKLSVLFRGVLQLFWEASQDVCVFTYHSPSQSVPC